MKRVVVVGSENKAQYAICDHPGCTNQFVLHYWGSIAAGDKGWFCQKNGDCWCPEHIPSWVAEWKARMKGNQ